MQNENNVVVIGSGPAGLTASIYLSRARLNPILIAGINWGGQLMSTTIVENFPGFPEGIMGPELMNRMLRQAESFGTQVFFENVSKIDKLKNNKFLVRTEENKEFVSKSILIATGASPRTLNIPGEKEFWAKGVSTCATCDGAFFRDKVVAVVGGGDSAMEEANFLTKFASKVYLIHRRETFRASAIMQEKINKNSKIVKIMNSEVVEILGTAKVNKIKILNKIDNSTYFLDCDGIFLAIGHIPATQFIKDLVEIDELGYIKSKDGFSTNLEGIFVAGDVEDHKYRQAITAAGAGCKAALEIEKWLNIH